MSTFNFCDSLSCKKRTHLSAATGLRIGAFGRPPTPISLVNVPFVFHHGHHKRHLVYQVLWYTLYFFFSLSFRKILAITVLSGVPHASISSSFFLLRTLPRLRHSTSDSRKFNAHETLEWRQFSLSRGYRFSRANDLAIISPSTSIHDRANLTKIKLCSYRFARADDVVCFHNPFAISTTTIAAATAAQANRTWLGSTAKPHTRTLPSQKCAAMRPPWVSVYVSAQYIAYVSFQCRLFRQVRFSISRPFVAAVRYGMSTPVYVWINDRGSWNRGGDERASSLADVEAGHLRHGVAIDFSMLIHTAAWRAGLNFWRRSIRSHYRDRRRNHVSVSGNAREASGANKTHQMFEEGIWISRGTGDVYGKTVTIINDYPRAKINCSMTRLFGDFEIDIHRVKLIASCDISLWLYSNCFKYKYLYLSSCVILRNYLEEIKMW